MRPYIVGSGVAAEGGQVNTSRTGLRVVNTGTSTVDGDGFADFFDDGKFVLAFETG